MLETSDKWAPTKKLVGIIEKIKSLMVVPNLETPMNQVAANSFKNGQWHQQAKSWTQQYAQWLLLSHITGYYKIQINRKAVTIKNYIIRKKRLLCTIKKISIYKISNHLSFQAKARI